MQIYNELQFLKITKENLKFNEISDDKILKHISGISFDLILSINVPKLKKELPKINKKLLVNDFEEKKFLLFLKENKLTEITKLLNFNTIANKSNSQFSYFYDIFDFTSMFLINKRNEVISYIESIQKLINGKNEVIYFKDKKEKVIISLFLQENELFAIIMDSNGENTEFSSITLNLKSSLKKILFKDAGKFGARPEIDTNKSMSKIFEIIKFLIKKYKLKSITFEGFKDKKQSKKLGDKNPRERLYLYLIKKYFGNKVKIIKIDNTIKLKDFKI